MKKSITIAAAALALFVCAVFSFSFAAQEKPEAPDKNTVQAASDLNAFACDMYKKLAETNKGNIFFSPASVSTALGMTYAGAKGKTAEEMKKALRYSLDDSILHEAMGKLSAALSESDNNCKTSIANSVWIQTGMAVLKEFADTLKKSYSSELNEADFIAATEAARIAINKWVETKTNEKIKDLLVKDVLSADTRMVLVNAIYFKGNWKTRFKKENTQKANFKVSDKETVKADMMYITKGKFPFLRGDGFSAVMLPYEGEKLSMAIFLPEKAGGIADLEKKLTGENIKTWAGSFNTTKLDVLAIPKFKTTAKYLMNDALKQLGMKEAFGMEADFSGMTGKPNLFISAVIHKAFVDVNEEGTEAAAATAVVVEGKSIQETIDFVADHPFIFMIMDKATGAILFMGKIINPLEKGE